MQNQHLDVREFVSIKGNKTEIQNLEGVSWWCNG